jgi:hypothetical protein
LNIRKGDFTKPELNEIHQLEKDKYMDNDWIFQTTDVPDAMGKVIVKTLGGLLDIRLVLAGKMIKSAYIHGDFLHLNMPLPIWSRACAGIRAMRILCRNHYPKFMNAGRMI